MKNILRKVMTPAAALTGALALTLGLSSPASAASAYRQVVVNGDTFNLVVAAPSHLSKDGSDVRVFGTGFNRAQGIFIALCVIPDSVDPRDPATYTERPTPCVGNGPGDTSGAAHRVTDTATGTPGITSRYGPNGSFRALLKLTPKLADGSVCSVDVRCALVTRADFTATNDRSYDTYIPVTFS
ncbi:MULTISPECIES: hypothetical protein [unclassified Streptomyces]|uniref:hypothetical protein n=1 Tax=unclassified Streptomyces TaxID=2593676 RepID=UPI0038252B28